MDFHLDNIDGPYGIVSYLQYFFGFSEMLCSSLCKENVLDILVAAAEVKDEELMRQVTAFLQQNLELLKKPEVIKKVVKNLDKKNVKKLLDLVK